MTSRIGPTQAAHIARVKQGYALLHQRRYSDAASLAESLLSIHPQDLHAIVLASETTLAAGDARRSLEMIEQAIVLSGGDPYLKLKKARLLGLAHRRGEFLALLAEIAAAAGEDGRLLWQMGSLCYRNNLQVEAIGYLEKARMPMGEPPSLLYELAIARFFNGEFDQAELDIERLLQFAPQSGPALYLRATLRRQTAASNHLADLRRRLGAGFPGMDDEAGALYALGKELEDLGEHAQSFDALSAGAAKKRRTFQYDARAECGVLREIASVYTAEAISADVPGHEGTGAIFIVGMPRSGTTLCERLLVQSGQAVSAGELQDFGNLLLMQTQQIMRANPGLGQAAATLRIDFAKLGCEYLHGARQMAHGSEVFIDKMPTNFMYCGMIHKALPQAKIIHLVRDPLDNCYAMFKTLFFNVYGFSYDLDELADYYIAYRHMMSHWHAAIPGRILDVRYEDLVADTETQARRLYAWCGLEWSGDALKAPGTGKVFATASAAQVREPVHTRSVGSASRHRERLAPLVQRLAAAGLASG